MPRLIRYTTLLSCLLLSQGIVAQSLSIQAVLDRAEMLTGEQAIIDVTIRTSDILQTKYHLIERADELSRFVVLSFGATDTIDLGGMNREIRAKILITSFDSTLISIPPIMAVLGSDTAITAPLALSVIQPQVDLEHPEKIKDIKSLWVVSYTWKDVLWLVLSSPILWFIIALILSAYGIYRYKQYKDSYPKLPALSSIPPSVSKTPREQLEEQLRILESRSYERQEDYKKLYSTLIDTLKTYLHQTKGWAWQEMTSTEVRAFLRLSDVPLETKQSIDQLLSAADMSKFAKEMPSEATAKASIHITRKIAQNIELCIEARQTALDKKA